VSRGDTENTKGKPHMLRRLSARWADWYCSRFLGYHTHTPWLKKYKPEEVRFSLVVARREGVMAIDGFEAVLRAARSQLGWKEAEE
jgi:hypothetical protein